jgi:hypothetical protein
MRLSEKDKLPTFIIRTAEDRKEMYEYMIQLIDAGFEFYLCNAVILLTGLIEADKLDFKTYFPELYAAGPIELRDRVKFAWYPVDDMASRKELLRQAIDLCHPSRKRLLDWMLCPTIAVCFMLLAFVTGCSQKTFVGGHLTTKQRIFILEARVQNDEKNITAMLHAILQQDTVDELLLQAFNGQKEKLTLYDFYINMLLDHEVKIKTLGAQMDSIKRPWNNSGTTAVTIPTSATSYSISEDTLWIDTTKAISKVILVEPQFLNRYVIMVRVFDPSDKWDVATLARDIYPVRYWRVRSRPKRPL